MRPEHRAVARAGVEVMALSVDHVKLPGADAPVHGRSGTDEATVMVRLPDIHPFNKKAFCL
jgi:hypothetical protein